MEGLDGLGIVQYVGNIADRAGKSTRGSCRFVSLADELQDAVLDLLHRPANRGRHARELLVDGRTAAQQCLGDAVSGQLALGCQLAQLADRHI